MAFVKHNSIKIGDTVKTTVKHESDAGYFEIGTLVKVIDISERGYDIVDEEGNRMIEIGWII